jgi:hypothetical protein
MEKKGGEMREKWAMCANVYFKWEEMGTEEYRLAGAVLAKVYFDWTKEEAGT